MQTQQKLVILSTRSLLLTFFYLLLLNYSDFLGPERFTVATRATCEQTKAVIFAVFHSLAGEYNIAKKFLRSYLSKS
jgi:hypothetical protein